MPQKFIRQYHKHRNTLWMVMGLLVTLLMVLPYVLLGQGSFVEVHDQMDGEVVNYIYQAKYLFQNGPIREFLGGMDKASMLPPAPLGVLFYAVLPPFAAFAAFHGICLVIAFLGMYGLLKCMKLEPEVACVVACLFAYLPFYPVYGLSAYGQPLLLWCFIGLYHGKHKIPSLLGIALVAGCSSLSLIGYAFVGIGVLVTIYLLSKKELNAAGRVALGVLTETVVYLALNVDLLKSMLGQGFTSHRQEMVLHGAQNSIGQFTELLFQGGAYSKTYAAVPMILLGIVILMLLGKNRQLLAVIGKWFLLILVGTTLSTLWNTPLICALRTSIGGPLPYFQADRIYWIFPFAWMVLFGLLLQVLVCEIQVANVKTLTRGILTVIGVGCILVQAALIFRDQPLNKNVRLLLQKGYQQTTWQSIYMDDVFDMLPASVTEEKEQYRVVSLGIHPAVALYHGFYCADGYSNNYELSYKYAFREIMAGELACSEEARKYYDEWGNRVYLCARPYGINGLVGKNSATEYEYPAFDLEKMRELGIRYLFSASRIRLEDAPEGITGQAYLKLIGDGPYVTEQSFYALWVYEIVVD